MNHGNDATSKLVGDYHVFPVLGAHSAAWNLLPKARDCFELRRHVLKLRWFPRGNENGEVCDLDWDWLDRRLGIGELRIHDRIGGHDNIRVIFYKTEVCIDGQPLPKIWIIDVFQKKTQKISNYKMRAFRAQRNLIFLRKYKSSKAE